MNPPDRDTTAVESQMQNVAEGSVEALAVLYPQAREIDLLNAYLKVFTERASEGGDDAD